MTDRHGMTPKRAAILIGLLAAILISGLGGTERGLEAVGLKNLETANQDYLEAAFNRSLRLFALLSAVKVGLAVVEGSEVGVGFGLEVGDIVQSTYDHVDIAWKTVLAAAVILQSLRFLLDSADLLDQWFLTLALVFILFMLLARWFAPNQVRTKRSCRDAGLLLTVLAVALYLLLPLSISGGHWLSNRITAPSLERAEEDLAQMERRLTYQEDETDDSLLTGLKNTKEYLQRMGAYLKQKANDLMVLLLTIIAVYIFDCLVFPLSLFLFLLWSTRLTARYLFGIKQAQNFKEDLETILEKFHVRRPPAEPPIRG